MSTEVTETHKISYRGSKSTGYWWVCSCGASGAPTATKAERWESITQHRAPQEEEAPREESVMQMPDEPVEDLPLMVLPESGTGAVASMEAEPPVVEEEPGTVRQWQRGDGPHPWSTGRPYRGI